MFSLDTPGPVRHKHVTRRDASFKHTLLHVVAEHVCFVGDSCIWDANTSVIHSSFSFAHTGHEPVLCCPLCLYMAWSFCCNLSSTPVSYSSFHFYSTYVPYPVGFHWSLPWRLSVCLLVSYMWSVFIVFPFIYLFLPHLISLCGSLLPFPVSLHFPLLIYMYPIFSHFLVSPCRYVCSSSLLFFHLALPFLCLSACRCRMCAATFFNKSDMQIHSKSHTEAKPHKCPHCAKSFANSSYLAQHIRIHSGAKPYTCSYCQKSFRQLSHLQQHTRYCRLAPLPPPSFPTCTVFPVLLTYPAKSLFGAQPLSFSTSQGRQRSGVQMHITLPCWCWLACYHFHSEVTFRENLNSDWTF